MIDAESIYLSLPVFLQNAAVSIEGWRLQRRRYSPRFDRCRAQVEERGRLRGADLRSLQARRLRALLEHAAETPFWRERFGVFAVDPRAVDPFAELAKLPVLAKDVVKEHASAIRHPGLAADGELLAVHTSGTTGSGLIFWETREAEIERWAVWWRYRSWHGIGMKDWCGYFGGRSLVPLTQTEAPYWRRNVPGRQLMFSAYHLGPETAKEYVKALERHSVPWLHGYPSFLALLASYVLEQHLRPPPVRVITTGAESLLPRQREMIEAAFRAPLHQHYGQTESVANISECEHGRLHVDEDFSFVELLPDPDRPGTLRIVGTNWSNPAFPLLRYDTADLATVVEVDCACGRPGRIIRDIDGRREDYVVLPGGARVGRLDHIFKDLEGIREAQIVQRGMDQITIRVVRGGRYEEEGGEARLLREARRRLGTEIVIDVEYVDRIERSANGKLRLVVSEVGGPSELRQGAAGA